MALPIRNTKTTEIAGLDTFYNGGKGSGNFGHKGRPGERGGSGEGIGASIEKFRKSPGMQTLIEKDKTGEVKDTAYYISKTAEAKDKYEKAEEEVDELTRKLELDEIQIAEYKKTNHDPYIVKALQERIQEISKQIDVAKEKRDKLYDAYEDAYALEEQHRREQDIASTFWR